jgi:hypothetical protein
MTRLSSPEKWSAESDALRMANPGLIRLHPLEHDHEVMLGRHALEVKWPGGEIPC